MAGTINIVGLGADDIEQLSIGIYRLLQQKGDIYVRTDKHPVVDQLKQDGVRCQSFDSVYEQYENFPEVYEAIAQELLETAQGQEIIYAVPGHPQVAERTVKLLQEWSEAYDVVIHIQGGHSFIDPMLTALGIDPIEGFSLMDAMSLETDQLPLQQHMIICQVYDAIIASEVKLNLLEHLPPDYEVTIVTAAGGQNEQVIKVPLSKLDHDFTTDNLTSVYVPPVSNERYLYHTFAKLRQVIGTLRGPNGCPWDRKQTHESLKPYLLEEAYEVIDAIDDEDDEHIAEELGDVLLQVMLHAQIGEDNGYFAVDDVIYGLTEKMIRRHPHVFSDGQADTAEDVMQNWDAIKANETNKQHRSHGLLWDVGKALPPLNKAFEYQKKAAKVGFDWSEDEPVWAKVYEELDEVKQSLMDSHESTLDELGDALFALVNVARHYNIHPEIALQRTNKKFYERFSYIERYAEEQGVSLSSMSLDRMDEIWEEAKIFLAKEAGE
ncbi:nucleoside triphosphate pyrophosphohydrolase [Tuberibacillus sp. Marseille-P3662]|uniref:nucleoside triphosphate pyrophosphohydrolase n=1 Tax=Tuberibacillus sp. Marseille-P3662 TaxID=1965358 RepID=UPI000A1CBA7F|nr:nucleoside triphosphate pyrophosphohydrolase [Tuberibacillus sp. Marseille-P3662]